MSVLLTDGGCRGQFHVLCAPGRDRESWKIHVDKAHEPNSRYKLYVGSQGLVTLSACQDTHSANTKDDCGPIKSQKAGGVISKGVHEGQEYILN